MKGLRVLLVAVLGLTLAGVAAFAADKEVSKTSTITLPKTLTVTGGSNLNFPHVSGPGNDAHDADATGTYSSNIVTYTIIANCDLWGRVKCTQFTHTDGTHTLPTKFGRRYNLHCGGGYGSWVWDDCPYDPGWVLLKHGSYFCGQIDMQVQLKVERNGYNDFAGTYTATFTMWLSKA